MDLADWIDSRPVSRFQVAIVVICGLAVMLDGFDAQIIGFIAPAILQDWHIPPASLASVFSAGLVGIFVGCLCLAPLADWRGRRVVMVASVLVFATASLATAWAQSLDQLVLLRFATGIGLGACMPNAVALTAEYAPQRVRGRLTTWMFTGFSLGAFVGGMLVARFVPTQGWRTMFVVGGVLPLVLLVAMALVLPESVRHMAARGWSAARIGAVLRRMDPAAHFPSGTRFVVNEARHSGFTVLHLFREGRAASTLLLWCMFFLMLLDVFLLASWTPTVLHADGLSVSAAVVATAVQQAGSVVATIFLGPLFDRFGFYRCLTPVLLGAGVAVAVMGSGGNSLWVIDSAAFFAGAGIMGGQTCMIVVAGAYYPTFIRATGAGWGLGIGRLGAIAGPLLGAWMLAAHWTPQQIFTGAAVPVMITAGLLLLMQRVAQVGPARRRAAATV